MLVDVDYNYSVREWGTDTFDVDDKGDLDHIEYLLESRLREENLFHDDVTNIEIIHVKETKRSV